MELSISVFTLMAFRFSFLFGFLNPWYKMKALDIASAVKYLGLSKVKLMPMRGLSVNEVIKLDKLGIKVSSMEPAWYTRDQKPGLLLRLFFGSDSYSRYDEYKKVLNNISIDDGQIIETADLPDRVSIFRKRLEENDFTHNKFAYDMLHAQELVMGRCAISKGEIKILLHDLFKKYFSWTGKSIFIGSMSGHPTENQEYKIYENLLKLTSGIVTIEVQTRNLHEVSDFIAGRDTFFKTHLSVIAGNVRNGKIKIKDVSVEMPPWWSSQIKLAFIKKVKEALNI